MVRCVVTDNRMRIGIVDNMGLKCEIMGDVEVGLINKVQNV